MDYDSYKSLPDISHWKNLPAGDFEVIINGDIFTETDFDTIERYIRSLKLDRSLYINILSKELIGDSKSMHVAYPEYGYDDGKGYIVEMIKCENEIDVRYQYRTLDIEKVLDIFKKYYKEQIIPNTEKWEDVTLKWI